MKNRPHKKVQFLEIQSTECKCPRTKVAKFITEIEK